MWKDPDGNPFKKGQFLSTLNHRPSNDLKSQAPHGAGHVNNVHHLEIENQTFKVGKYALRIFCFIETTFVN